MSVTLAAFQSMIARTYHEKDGNRGIAGTIMWFTEEVGELARALKRGTPDEDNLLMEFGDVLAWLATLANLAGIYLDAASRRYMDGCPRCRQAPCACGEATRFQTLAPRPTSRPS